MRKLQWISLLVLVAWSHLTQGDLYHYMEDAFADPEMKCPQSERTVVCRLGHLQTSALEKLDPCLCTHVVIHEGNDVSLQKLKLANPDLLVIRTTPMENLLREDDSATTAQALAVNILEEGYDGVDLTMREEGDRTKFLEILKELDKHLSTTNSPKKWLHLTFLHFIPPVSLIEGIFRSVNVNSFTFFTDFSQNNKENLEQSEKISKLGIPYNKTLLGIALKELNEEDSTTAGGFLRQRCSEIPERSKEQKSFDDDKETRKKLYDQRCSEIPERSKEQKSFDDDKETRKKLYDQVEYVEQNKEKYGGVDIWSLAQDDAEGLCGKGPFPILQYISHAMSPDAQSFDEFADLDIILSTGESEELESFLQNVDIDPEEMKKLPCDRVGFYRHPADCSKFYHCSEYRSTKFNHTGPYAGFLYKCPKGLVYDERQESCVWASRSDPCQGSGELLPVPSKKFSCVVPGFHADPENCRWFYYCSDLGDGGLEAFEFLCPSDLLGYDEDKMLCNWKWTVPACLNGGKHTKTKIESSSSPEAQRFGNAVNQHVRTPKELNIHDNQNSFDPTSLVSKDKHQIESNSREDQGYVINVETEIKIANTNSSNNNNSQPFSITDNNKHKIPDVENVKVRENHFSLRDELPNERQSLPEKKYGTAVWRRSWVRDSDSNRRITIPKIGLSDVILDYNGDGKRKLNNGGNIHQSHQNDFYTNNHNGEIPSLVNKNNPKREFEGIERENYNNWRTDQFIELRNKNDRNAEQETTRSRNPQEYPGSESYNQRNNKDEISHISREAPERDVETFTVQNQQKSGPFLNVRCSKLQNNNNHPQETGVLGCTSEVSLTIQLKRGKDSSKYILKEDKIRRTALQESNPVRYTENPYQTTARSLATDTSKTDSADFSHSSISNLNKQHVSSEKVNGSSDTFILHTLNAANQRWAKLADDTKLNTAQDEHFTASSLLKSQESYDVKTPSVFNAQHQSTSTQPTDVKSTEENNYNAPKNERSNKKFKNYKDVSMPIHFFPQGVLLNINIAHINEIPPQILLEVDHMLRSYMNDGDIDLNLLEEKLNASAESMVGMDDEKMEPEEIMEMIKVIENIINVSREIEISTPEVNSIPTEIENIPINETEIYSSTTTEVSDEIEYENISVSKNIPEKYSSRNDNESSLSDHSNNQNTQVIKDLENIRVDVSEASTSSFGDDKGHQTPFVRRRLIRKYRYPSIREQLERQNKFRNNLETIEANPYSEAESSFTRKANDVSYIPQTNETTLERTMNHRNNFNEQSTSFQTIPTVTEASSSEPLIQNGHWRIVSEQKRTQRPENNQHFSVHPAQANQGNVPGIRPEKSQHFPVHPAQDNQGNVPRIRQENNQHFSVHPAQANQGNVPRIRQENNQHFSVHPAQANQGNVPRIRPENNQHFSVHPAQANQGNVPRIRPENNQHFSVHPAQANQRNVPRPPSTQGENFQTQWWKNREAFQDNSNTYPPAEPVSLQTYSHGSTAKESLSTTGGDLRNFEIRTFQQDAYSRSAGIQSLYPEQRNDITPTKQFGDQTQTWLNQKTSPYDSNWYASLKPETVTETYGGNINKHTLRSPEKDAAVFDIKTFTSTNYHQPSVNRTILRVTQENNAQRSHVSQYGSRIREPENKSSQSETYGHSFRSYSDSRLDTGNLRTGDENTRELEETTDGYNYVLKTTSHQREKHFTYDDEYIKSETDLSSNRGHDYFETGNIPPLKQNLGENGHGYAQSEQDIRSSNKQTANSVFRQERKKNADVDFQQRRKKRKLRILVKKLSNSASVPRGETLPVGAENNGLQPKISKDVLDALKNRFLHKHARNGADDIELQIQYQDHVWNVPFVGTEGESSLSPDACTRPGLFQHPKDCKMFYECFWDKWLQRYTLHVFSCPVKLVYDESVQGCSRPDVNLPCRSVTR